MYCIGKENVLQKRDLTELMVILLYASWMCELTNAYEAYVITPMNPQYTVFESVFLPLDVYILFGQYNQK